MIKYTIELMQTKDEPGWFVQVKGLPGCMSQGETVAEALVNIQDALTLWLGVALDDSDPPPVPDCYACKVCLRPIEVTIEGESICAECRAIQDLDDGDDKYDASIEGYLSGMETFIKS